MGATDTILAAPTPQTEREDDRTNNVLGALVLENKSASVPTARTEETFIGR